MWSRSLCSAMIVSPPAGASSTPRRSRPCCEAKARKPRWQERFLRTAVSRASRQNPTQNSAPLEWLSLSCLSTEICFFVVKFEIDERAKHLQVGNQRVHFGRCAGFAIEISGDRFRISLQECIDVYAVWISLSPQIRDGVGNLIIRIRNAYDSARPQMIRHCCGIDFGLSQKRISRHHRLRNDRARIGEMGDMPF